MAVNLTYTNLKDCKIFLYTLPMSAKKKEVLLEHFSKKNTFEVPYYALEVYKKLQKAVNANIVDGWKPIAVGDATANLIIDKSKDSQNKLKLLDANLNNVLNSDNIEMSLANFKPEVSHEK